MAAKHDGKQARANYWVAQQNLAKQKGGRPKYQAKPKVKVASASNKPKFAKFGQPKAAPVVAVVEESNVEAVSTEVAAPV